MKKPPNRFRFTLRTLLEIVLVVAICTAFPVIPLFVVWIVPLSGPALGFGVFLFVRNATRSGSVASWPTFLGWLAACLAFAPFVACWFIRYRWVNAFTDDEWPRPFPYPDLFLLEMHDWWDRLHPADGFLKIHGEFYAVLLGVNALVLIACVLVGAVCGYVFRDGDFLAASRRLTSWFLRRVTS